MGDAQNPRSAEWYRNVYRDLSTAGKVLAAETGVDNAAAVPDSKHTIYVQKVTIHITTAAAQVISVKDDNSTAVDVLVVEASAAAGVIRTIDYGAKGLALTVGKNLDIANTAGPAYTYSIECYARQTAAAQSTTITRIF